MKYYPDVGKFSPSDQAPKFEQGCGSLKNEGRKTVPVWGPLVLFLEVGWTSFRPPFFRARGPLDPKIVMRPDARSNGVLEVVQLVAGTATAEQAATQASLHQLIHNAALTAADGKVTVKDNLKLLDEAIRRVFQGRSWSEVFEAIVGVVDRHGYDRGSWTSWNGQPSHR